MMCIYSSRYQACFCFFLTTICSLNAWSKAPLHVQSIPLPWTPKSNIWKKKLLHMSALLGILTKKTLSSHTFFSIFLLMQHALVQRPTMVQFSGASAGYKHATKTSAFLLSDLNYTVHTLLTDLGWVIVYSSLGMTKNFLRNDAIDFASTIFMTLLLEDLSPGAGNQIPEGEKDGEGWELNQ